MFTGIIETTGILTDIKQEGTNIHFFVECAISKELKPDQSVAHDGVCLTITENNQTGHWVTAVAETLQKTNISGWKKGKTINIERAMRLGDRLDGHIVQGHVDTTATCTRVQEVGGSYLFEFHFPDNFAALIIEKGSICINGVSLTAFHVGKDCFSVTIIPYTFAHTTFNQLKESDAVNLEFDILGKYMLRQTETGKN